MLPLTVITGLFGMNVLFPGEGTHAAFWIILGVMVAAARRDDRRSSATSAGSDRGSGQAGDRFVGRDDVWKLILQARKRGPVDQIGPGKNSPSWTFVS